MRVRIVKSGYDSYWYSNNIGEEFEVQEYSPTDYELVENPARCIKKTDCIIISNKEENYIVIEGKKIKLSEETVRSIKESLTVEKLEWILEIGELYYFITTKGTINNTTWVNSELNKDHFKTGNVFKTYEIAEQKLLDMNDEIQQTFIKIENYVRNNGEDWKANWKDNTQVKYYIVYDGEWKKVSTWYNQSTHTFMSEQMADKVLKMLKGGE